LLARVGFFGIVEVDCISVADAKDLSKVRTCVLESPVENRPSAVRVVLLMRRAIVVVSVSLFASTSLALPPNSKLRQGANHHVGDEGFIAKFGRPPNKHDGEKVRMQTHLQHIHDWLASRPATKPELDAKRKQILGYLADYIAKGTTPRNKFLPWRTPVFIDDEGTICAVGSLIERSVGRALPEQIAKQHRYEFIDEIAREMPDVQAWVEASGLTLEEIAAIQPAYSEPAVNTWRTWDLVKHAPKDGAYEKHGWTGTFRHKRMEGTWSVRDDQGQLLGQGEMKHGAGTWVSFYPDGKRFGEGPYVNNRAQGAWKLFHKSGNLAAEGSFSRGNRSGNWKFYYDAPEQTPIAIGRFDRSGAVDGRWQHFDSAGKLFATSRNATPEQWHDDNWYVDGGEGFLIDIEPGDDGVRHQIHQGDVNSAEQKLESFALGNERVFIHSAFGHETTYDADGLELEHTAKGWQASACGWATKRKQIAHEGDLTRLHGLLYQEARNRLPDEKRIYDSDGTDPGPTCRPAQPVDTDRGQRLDALLATSNRVRAIAPEFMRQAVLYQNEDANEDDTDAPRAPTDQDLAHILAENMTMYIEWPHIDGRFTALYSTMAGRITWNWTDGDPDRDEIN
jgi:hypothetical protein